MIRAIAISSASSSSSSSLFSEALDLNHQRSSRSSTICNSQRSHTSIPKLDSFSRSKILRGMKEPSFIQKSENALADYCSTLEGDNSYNCWRAYFELKNLEAGGSSKEEIENLVRQTDGVKSLVHCLHGISATRKRVITELETNKPWNSTETRSEERPCHIPDGLPKTREELEEEEKARMPDSTFTRLLRSKGSFPAWYSPAPDHET